jgi:amino acid transporter
MAPATGGPYAYTRMAFGDFAGFLVAWGYWISIWASLPVIALAFAGAILNAMPSLYGRTMGIGLTLGAIWLVVGVNLRGVKAAGIFASVTTYVKLVPFAAVALLGLFYIQPANLSEFNPSGASVFTSFAILAPLTMFAYLGLESATVPAGDVRDAERTIPRSTILGIGIAASLYVLGTIAVLGIVPRDQLIGSVAPFSDAGRIMWGAFGATLVSLAVIISSLGALNGWTLLMGQVPMAAANDRLFPAVFGKKSKRGVPATSIIISASLATILVLVQAAGSPGVQAFYNMIVNLSTMAAVVPYAFCALAFGLASAKINGGSAKRLGPVNLIAFLFAIFTLYGCGPEPVLYGTVMLMLGIPVYVYQQRRISITSHGYKA